MAKDIRSLFKLEKRDPVSITLWLKSQGFDDESIKIAMAEHAQAIADGKRFGYVNGISVLSNSIRARVTELTKQKADNMIAEYGVFSPTEPLKTRIWKKLNQPIKLGKKANGS